MQEKIQTLDDSKATTVYTQEINSVNFETGEIIDKQEIKFIKEKSRHNFIQLYVDNITFLSSSNITNIERQVLIFIFSQITFYNVVRVNVSLRKLLKVGTALSDSSVSRAINGLIEKEVLLKIPEENCEKYNIKAYIGDEYLLNPQLAGKGSFNDMKNLRQTVITDFDFENLEMKQQIIREAKYDGFDEIAENIDKHEIKEIKQITNDDNNFKNTEIVIREKPNEILDIGAVSKGVNQDGIAIPFTEKELDYAMLIAENEAKKLENEKIKLEIELLTMKNNQNK